MNHRKNNHLSLGQLIALSQPDIDFDDHPEKTKHFDQCNLCKENYGFVVNYKKEHQDQTDNIVKEILENCTARKSTTKPVDDIKNSVPLLVAVLDSNIPGEQRIEMLSHLNNCLRCLQSFAANWNDYLDMLPQE